MYQNLQSLCTHAINHLVLRKGLKMLYYLGFDLVFRKFQNLPYSNLRSNIFSTRNYRRNLKKMKRLLINCNLYREFGISNLFRPFWLIKLQVLNTWIVEKTAKKAHDDFSLLKLAPLLVPSPTVCLKSTERRKFQRERGRWTIGHTGIIAGEGGGGLEPIRTTKQEWACSSLFPFSVGCKVCFNNQWCELGRGS